MEIKTEAVHIVYLNIAEILYSELVRTFFVLKNVCTVFPVNPRLQMLPN